MNGGLLVPLFHRGDILVKEDLDDVEGNIEEDTLPCRWLLG